MSSNLKVIGAGLGRTGTLSLKYALEQLGFAPCYHMHELLSHPQHAPLWRALHRGGDADCDTLFEGYNAIVDYPGCVLYRELLSIYPAAKVVLTVRDPNIWYESVRETIYQLRPRTMYNKFRFILRLFLSSRFRRAVPAYRLVNELVWRQQFGGEFEGREHAIDVFNRHISEVKSVVPPGQLLVFDVREGWGPLCRFLNVPEPGVPFPCVNNGEQFHRVVDGVIYHDEPQLQQHHNAPSRSLCSSNRGTT